MSQKTVIAVLSVVVLLGLAGFVYRPSVSTALVFAVVVLIVIAGALWHLRRHRPDSFEDDKKLP